MKLKEWKDKMMEEVEGTVFISCVMQEVPWHDNTTRYQVYNDEGTYDKLFNIAIDDDGETILSIESFDNEG